MSLNPESAKRLEELERQWKDKFIVGQPKLPTTVLLMVAVSMALAFGGVLFALSLSMRPYAWAWFALSALLGLISRILSKRWFTRVVIPWDKERRAAATELKTLRERNTQAAPES